MQITALDHLVLTVRDLNATCTFYTNILGMREVRFDEKRRALVFGQQKINLHKEGNELGPKADRATPGSADLCFILEGNIKDTVGELKKLGIKIIAGPVSRTGAQGPITSIYIKDPDRNLIELASY